MIHHRQQILHPQKKLIHHLPSTLSGKVQKGPYIQGTEITVRELDSSITPTGNTFTGTIDDKTGSFSIKGKLSNIKLSCQLMIIISMKCQDLFHQQN